VTFDLTIRLGQTDAAGVVYFARYFDLAHDVYERALAEAGLPLTPEMLGGGVLLPIVHAEASYAAPLHVGDHVAVTLGTEDVRERSFSLVYGFSRDGTHVCRVRTVHVAVNAADFRPTVLPESVRTVLTAWPKHT
jgi:1,4-dihydroxy-2-naphthoyl-CoA hydrolase